MPDSMLSELDHNDLAELIYDLDEFAHSPKKTQVIWVYKEGDREHHKQLIPSEIDKVEWTDGDKTFTFDLALSGVPLDADTFEVHLDGVAVLTDALYGTGHRRFYTLTITVGSKKGEFFPEA